MIEYTVRVHHDKTEWFLNGLIHRENGPAVEYADGDKSWYQNGQRHREDGPALEYANGGYKAWYLNGVLHREDGPALEKTDGYKEWWINGEKLTEDEFNNRDKTLELTVADIEKLLGHKVKVVSNSVSTT